MPLPSKAKTAGAQSENTVRQEDAALTLFNQFQEQNNDPFYRELTDVALEADNLQHILENFAIYLSSTQILAQKGGLYLKGSTKYKYWEKMKILFGRDFPNHPLWKEDGGWVYRVKNTIEENSNRLDLIQGFDSSDPKTRAMYMKTRPFALRSSDRTDEQGKDLYSILESILKERDHKMYANRLQLLLVYYGAGRGGEHKFLRLDECTWDYKFELMETEWPQKKVATKHLSTFCSCPPNAEFDGIKDCFEADIFHAFACFFAAEDGLYRDPHQDAHVIKFLFPELHSIRDDSVAKRLRDLMRKHCHKPLQKLTSPKSLRKGANTFLSKHVQVTEKQRLARGGWAARNSSETPAYFEVTPELVTPSVFALAGWPNVKVCNLPMRITIEMMEADSRIEAFHKQFYTYDLKQLERARITYDAFLKPFLWTCTAAAILYFPQMYKKYGPKDRMISKMLRIGGRVPLGTGPAEVSTVLTQWSKQIKEDFEERNIHIDPADANNLIAVINQMSAIIGKLRETVTRLEAGQQQTAVQADLTNSKLSLIFDRLQNITKRSLGSPSTRACNEDSPQAVIAKRPRVDSPSDTAATAEAPKSLEAKATIQPDVFTTLMTSRSRSEDQKEGSMKGKRLSDSLKQLYEKGQLGACTRKEDLLTLAPPFSIGHRDRNKWKACMELVVAVITQEQQNLLFGKSNTLDDHNLKEQTYAIERNCRQYVADITNKPFKNLSGKVSGLGQQYINYKKSSGGSVLTSLKSAFMKK